MVKRGNTTDALFVIPQLDRSKLVFKKVICGEYPVEAIIDTGSGITVVSPNFSKMLGIPLQPWVGPDILLADGQRTRPSGSVEIKVTIDNIVVEVSAIVLQINGYDLLLGNDTLRKLIFDRKKISAILKRSLYRATWSPRTYGHVRLWPGKRKPGNYPVSKNFCP